MSVADPFGRSVTSNPTSVVVAGASNGYGQAVIASNPEYWYRMDELSGSGLRDSRGAADATGPASLTRRVSGALSDGDDATGFPGNSSGFVAAEVSHRGPQVVSVEAWIKTTTTQGGRIVGFGDRRDATSKSGWTDRHLFMDNAGRLFFGVDNGSKRQVGSTPGYNDNTWHHVVGTLGPDGLRLYVDGRQVAANTGVTSARDMRGMWKIGGDILAGWGSRPTSDYFAGSIDEVAIYHRVLSAAEVQLHFDAASGSGQVPNEAPVAAIGSSVSGLSVSLDGSGSSDADGSVVSWAWDFGDGASGSGASVSHAYAAAGTYTVALTVTDDGGATGSATRSVTVAGPGNPAPFAADAFGRSVSGGWGSADVGGAWSVGGGAANFAVAGGAGSMTVPAAGRSVSAYLGSVSALDQDLSFSVASDRVAGGGGAYLNVAVRGGASDAYRAKVWIRSDGSVRVQAVRVLGGAQATLATADVAGLTAVPGGRLMVRVQAAGASPTTVRAKVWAAGSPEPADWAVSATDASPALQVPGGLGMFVYVSGSASNTPVTYSIDDLVAGDPGGGQGPPPANQAPVAAIGSSVSGLSVSLDGSGSSDADGSVVSWAWDFGDGASGSGASVSHAYAAAGTYTVALTVTDDGGATGSATRSVTVAGPGNPAPFAADAFGRSVSGGWGSADVGGAWSVGGGAANFAVAGGAGSMTVPAAGRSVSAYLGSVSALDQDLSFSVASDRVAGGGGAYLNVAVRGGASDAYRAKVWIRSDGSVRVQAVRVLGGAQATLATADVAGLTAVPGGRLMVRVQAAGASPTTVRAKVWAAGSPEPADWAVSATDASPALQVPGGLGMFVYVSGSASNTPVTYSIDDLVAA